MDFGIMRRWSLPRFSSSSTWDTRQGKASLSSPMAGLTSWSRITLVFGLSVCSISPGASFRFLSFQFIPKLVFLLFIFFFCLGNFLLVNFDLMIIGFELWFQVWLLPCLSFGLNSSFVLWLWFGWIWGYCFHSWNAGNCGCRFESNSVKN